MPDLQFSGTLVLGTAPGPSCSPGEELIIQEANTSIYQFFQQFTGMKVRIQLTVLDSTPVERSARTVRDLTTPRY